MFFDQWLSRPGAPELRIANATAVPTIAGWRLNVTLSQGAPPYALSVPLVIRTSGGEITHHVQLAGERDTVARNEVQKQISLRELLESETYRRSASKPRKRSDTSGRRAQFRRWWNCLLEAPRSADKRERA